MLLCVGFREDLRLLSITQEPLAWVSTVDSPLLPIWEIWVEKHLGQKLISDSIN